MPALRGRTRTAFLIFFVSHIPITLIIDGQGLFPDFYPDALKNVVAWYAVRFKDKLMTTPPPPWFSSLIFLEVFLQVPFFVLAVYALLQSSKNNSDGTSGHALVRGDGVFRSLCLIYGSSTATTLVPILASVLTDRETTVGEKGCLLGFYLPYLIFPLWLVAIAIVEDNVFGAKDAGKLQ